MEILVEIHPKKKIEKIIDEIKTLSSFDGFNIPDSPLGYPAPLPSSIASIIRHLLNLNNKVIINQRLYDVNELFVHSLSITARMMNVSVAFTKGDKPKYGREVGYLSSEEAVNIAKGYGISAGMMISLRRNENEIKARLNSNADFFLVLRMRRVDELEYYGHNLLSRAIPYLIIATEKNKKMVEQLNQPTFNEEEIISVINQLKDKKVKGVLLSTLGDLEALRKLNEKI